LIHSVLLHGGVAVLLVITHKYHMVNVDLGAQNQSANQSAAQSLVAVSLESISVASPPKSPQPQKPASQVVTNMPAGAGGAAQAASTADGTADGTADSAGTSVATQQSYMASLRRLLESEKKYPPLARSLGQQGKVVLRFLVARDGRLSQAQVVESSGVPALDRAAIDLIGDLERAPPFPSEMTEEQLVVTVPLVYSLN
jgi:protein TonB